MENRTDERIARLKLKRRIGKENKDKNEEIANEESVDYEEKKL